MQIISHPSPNFDSRGDVPIEKLILHYTGMQTGQEAFDRLCDADARVSAHYVVEEDGRIFQLVEEAQRAWHAGVSYWRGCQDINARSIGIEIVNPGHEWGYRPFPAVQIRAVIALCQDILSRNPLIPSRCVVGHSDVAFRRKQDPGEFFPWAELAAAGVGLWHGDPAAKVARPLRVDDVGEAVRQMQEMLIHYGYGIPVDGIFGMAVQDCVIAFQRHFRPSRCDGVWDGDCAAKLEALLRLL